MCDSRSWLLEAFGWDCETQTPGLWPKSWLAVWELREIWWSRVEVKKGRCRSIPSEQSRIQQLHSIQLTKVQQQTSRIQQPKGRIQQPKRQNSQLHDTLSTTRMRCYVAECGTGFLVDEPKLTNQRFEWSTFDQLFNFCWQIRGLQCSCWICFYLTNPCLTVSR